MRRRREEAGEKCGTDGRRVERGVKSPPLFLINPLKTIICEKFRRAEKYFSHVVRTMNGSAMGRRFEIS